MRHTTALLFITPTGQLGKNGQSELGVSGRPSSLEECERQTTDGLDQQYETYLNLYGGRKRGHYDQQAQTDHVGPGLDGLGEVRFVGDAADLDADHIPSPEFSSAISGP